MIAERNGKYVVYDATGNVLLITSNKRIAENYVNNS